MLNHREAMLRRGPDLIARLPDITPERADERLRPVYDDIKRTLRVPFVNYLFRVLANYPNYLVPAWNRTRPLVCRPAFEEGADDLRSRALLEPLPNAAAANWDALADMNAARAFTDSIHYVLPKLLLVATAFDENLPAADWGERCPDETGGSTGELPVGVAEGTCEVSMVDPKDAPERLSDLFEDIRQRHLHPGIATYYRGLGHWPEFLQAVWGRIGAQVGSEAYQERRQYLIAKATETIGRLAAPAEPKAVSAGAMGPEKPQDVTDILAVFRWRLIPDLLLDVSLIKALLDGPQEARRSRFSLNIR